MCRIGARVGWADGKVALDATAFYMELLDMMEQGLSFHFKDSKHIKPTSCNVIEDIFNVWWGRTLSLSNWLHCGGAEGRRGGGEPGQEHRLARLTLSRAPNSWLPWLIWEQPKHI